MKNKKIVLIGGGTGSSTLLKELKKHNDNLTAIVTVADDGGSSGLLRKDFGMLPPGDVRNCILALADDEAVMTNLLNHRFDKGSFKKHSFGNLFIAAMNEISSNFPEAIRQVSEVLNIKGRVLPVTEENVTLSAQLDNGAVIYGESKISKQAARKRSKIRKIMLNPADAKAYSYTLSAINQADIIIFSPGSIYTSIIPNLLVKDVAKAISKSKAKRFFVVNLMTQEGESKGYDVGKHVQAIEKHLDDGIKVFDYVLYNILDINEDMLKVYGKENAMPVKGSYDKELEERYEFIPGELACVLDNRIRHNSSLLWEIISEIVMNKNC